MIYLIVEYLIEILIASILAGIIGALGGLGGGVLIVPFLTLYFHVPISLAIGASIVSVIATSSGSAAAYVRDKISNIRIGTFLVLFTTTGAILGAFIEHVTPVKVLFFIFGVVLIISVIPMLKKIGEEVPNVEKNDPLAEKLGLYGEYYDSVLKREVKYKVTGVKPGAAMMFMAGTISGLLGIGSGAFKVLAMDLAMRLPIKVSTTTSNFMIGVTAAASAGIYFFTGDVNPFIAAPVAMGVLIGAIIGTKILVRIRSSSVRKIFAVIILIVGLEMILRGAGVI
ncbi:MAG: sulfite exporter TauE/SafE family protein [Thermoplasmatales archaeon]